MNTLNLAKATLRQLIDTYPFIDSFFESNGIEDEFNAFYQTNPHTNLHAFFTNLGEEFLEDKAIDIDETINMLQSFIEQMLEFLGESDEKITSLTILPGQDKSGNSEKFDNFTVTTGEIISIVGPTGSGKSRLLGDIEWVAQCDTPTKRKILLNNEIPDSKWRFSTADKLVAQLSQNMNFVMDLSVFEFVEMHARSRMVEQESQIIARIIEEANRLAGEKFSPNTPITSLSGGQSRALMIADTAILSKSPIVLIDEIENAGIDRKKALKLLLKEDKIVLMATHDPLLALMADKRIVIKNGGIDKIIETKDNERNLLVELEQVDKKIQNLRHSLRHGETITQDLITF